MISALIPHIPNVRTSNSLVFQLKYDSTQIKIDSMQHKSSNQLKLDSTQHKQNSHSLNPQPLPPG